MKKILYLLPFFLSGCATMYIPPMSNVPLFEGKGETQIELSASTNSLSAFAGYAITENYAIMINGNSSYGNYSNWYDITHSKDDHSTSYINPIVPSHYNHNYAEMSVAKYGLLHHSILRMEALIGGGYGCAKDGYDSEYESYHNKYGLAFTQVNFGLRVPHFDAGASARISSSFHNYEWRYNGECTKKNEDFVLFHVEPMLFARVGGEHLKLLTKIGLSLPIETKSFEHLDNEVHFSETRTTNFHISVGVHYSF